MFKKCPKGLLIGAVAVTILAVASSATAFLPTSGSQYLASLFDNSAPAAGQPDTSSDFASFSLYGQQKPATKIDLCNFLDSRLHDLKILAPKALHRYTTDFSLHCKPDNLRPSAPENQTNSSGQLNFLRNARSGLDAVMKANSIFTIFDNKPLI